MADTKDHRRGIAHWPQTERPRERLLAKGSDALSDAHLLAILLRTGRRDSSAVQVAIELLDRMGGLGGIAACGIEELCAIPGVGLAKAAQLKAALALGRRSLAIPLSTGTRISSSANLFKHFHPALRDVKHELFKVVLLDAKNTVLKETTVSEGSLTLSIVHPREVFTLAVRESAAAVIFVHNHPSGDPTPSQEDRRLTDRLVAAGRLLGIRVLDHLIIGDSRYVSFADEGWLSGFREDNENI
ncbi:MAG: DNA repair protein RadC [Nitrospira sp.]|nr:DNA repair protein RadC [Nitrospira sp.]